jgi:hypothetical protein
MGQQAFRAIPNEEPMPRNQPAYTLSDAARETGRVNNRKLLKKLIVRFKIPTYRIGRSVMMDRQGYDRLLKAVKEWDNRLKRSAEGNADASGKGRKPTKPRNDPDLALSR